MKICMPPYYSCEGLYEDLHAILYSGGFLQRFACHHIIVVRVFTKICMPYCTREGFYEDLHAIVLGRVLM